MDEIQERVNCKFCDERYSIFLVERHQRRCYLNPINAEKIAGYLKRLKFSRKELSRFFKENGISIYNLFEDSDNSYSAWTHVVIKIILNLYDKKFIDLEYYDLIINRITDGFNGYSYYEYLSKKEKYFKDSQLEKNYEILFYAILAQAIKDLILLNDNDVDFMVINEIEIDRIETEEFLEGLSQPLYFKIMELLKTYDER